MHTELRRIRAWLGIFCLAACLSPARAQTPPQTAPSAFAIGADLSLLQTLQDHGVAYREGGAVKDPLLLFKEHGWNYVRLRLFVAPDGTKGQVNTLPYTLALAKRVKQAGLSLLIDFHYSDHWADPGHQSLPAAWKGLSHPELAERVSSYTRDTLEAFRAAGCLPDMVQIGNEITHGMLWPDGGPLGPTDAKWDAFADLIKAGIRGVKEADPQGAIKIMIHIDRGSHESVCRWFFDNLLRRGAQFDIIGLSYYPFFNGSLDTLRANLAALSKAYGKDIIVAETSCDAAGGGSKKVSFPPTPEGQKAFLEGLLRVVAATPGGYGKGVFYWMPECIMGARSQGAGLGGAWENRALFDPAGNTRPAMDAPETREPK